jgi:hypothetical protein
MSERVMSGKVAFLPSQVEPQTHMWHSCWRSIILYFKALKTVSQAVPQSMCNEVASARVFGTADFDRSEAIVL